MSWSLDAVLAKTLLKTARSPFSLESRIVATPALTAMPSCELGELNKGEDLRTR